MDIIVSGNNNNNNSQSFVYLYFTNPQVAIGPLQVDEHKSSDPHILDD